MVNPVAAIGLLAVLSQVAGCPAVITARITNQTAEPVSYLVHASYAREVPPGGSQNVPWRHDCIAIDTADGPRYFDSVGLPASSYRKRIFSVRLDVSLTSDGELVVKNREGSDVGLRRIPDCEL